MDPFLSDRHARWHPVDLSLFPLRPPPRRPSIITRSLTLARYATTPVYTGVQDLSPSARSSRSRLWTCALVEAWARLALVLAEFRPDHHLLDLGLEGL